MLLQAAHKQTITAMVLRAGTTTDRKLAIVANITRRRLKEQLKAMKAMEAMKATKATKAMKDMKAMPPPAVPRRR